MNRTLAIVGFVLGLFVAAQLAAQSTIGATLVKAARLFDPRTGSVLAPAAVLIEGNKIGRVGASSRISAP